MEADRLIRELVALMQLILERYEGSPSSSVSHLSSLVVGSCDSQPLPSYDLPARSASSAPGIPATSGDPTTLTQREAQSLSENDNDCKGGRNERCMLDPQEGQDHGSERHGLITASAQAISPLPQSSDRKRKRDDLTFYGIPESNDLETEASESRRLAKLYLSGNCWYEFQGTEDPAWLEETKEEWVLLLKHSQPLGISTFAEKRTECGHDNSLDKYTMSRCARFCGGTSHSSQFINVFFQIFEQPHLASEAWAAITMMPNADSPVKRLGVDVADSAGNLNEQIRYFSAAGKLLHVTNVAETAYRWQASTRCVHRAHFHEQLKKIALSADGVGPPAQLHKSSRIEKVDAETAMIFHSDGSTEQGDVLVGADGVHPITRQSLEPTIHPFKGHRSAFRFLMTRKAALEDPTTRELASIPGSLDMWYAADRKIVMYPCADNTLLNFVCIFPAELSDTGQADARYSTKGSQSQLLHIFQDFTPELKAFLAKAEPDTIKLWPLYDMEQLPSYVLGRLALIGDAAHPFLPHLAQGGAQTIEDALTLAIMLESGVEKSAVPLRLQLYNEARYKRASQIQEWTRLAGDDSVKDAQASKAQFSVVDFMERAISHNKFHHSTRLLRQHKWQQNANQYWREPIAFGPVTGTPPSLTSQSREGAVDFKRTGTTATITFKTSATLLRTLFPNEPYAFKKRDTVVFASFRLHTYKQAPGGNENDCHILALYMHSIVYNRSDQNPVEGAYIPVLFADSAITGLDDIPMVHSDIKIYDQNDRYSLQIGCHGTIWGRIEWSSLVNTTEEYNRKLDSEAFLLHWHILADDTQNQKSRPDTGYATYLECDRGSQTKPIKQIRTSTGNSSFHFDAYDWKRLPTLHHIVSWLADLPVFEVVEASIVENAPIPSFSELKRVE